MDQIAIELHQLKRFSFFWLMYVNQCAMRAYRVGSLVSWRVSVISAKCIPQSAQSVWDSCAIRNRGKGSRQCDRPRELWKANRLDHRYSTVTMTKPCLFLLFLRQHLEKNMKLQYIAYNCVARDACRYKMQWPNSWIHFQWNPVSSHSALVNAHQPEEWK